MSDQNIINALESDVTDLFDRISKLDKLLHNFGEKIVKQQEIIDVLTVKIQSCPYG